MFQRIHSWMFPSFCATCGRQARHLCGRCFHQLGFEPCRFELEGLQVLSSMPYDPDLVIGQLVHRFKFQHGFLLRELFAAYMSCSLQLFKGEPRGFALVPVPSSPSRRSERGFDPAEELAKGLRDSLGLPIFTLLQRRDTLVKQSQLHRKERLKNVEGVFKLKNLPPKGYELILVDDIVTTGATLLSAWHCLQAEGVEVDSALTLAHRDAKLHPGH